MLRKTLCGTVAVSLLVLAASTAHAQFASPIRFNVNAGAALPVGDFGDREQGGADLGFRLGAGLEIRPPLMPIGFRLDGAFDRLDMEADDPDVGTLTGNWTIWSVTANAVFQPAVSPLYFIGGVGFYSVKPTFDFDGGSVSADAENEFGFNLGLGFSLPLPAFSPFIEARWNRINLDDEEGGSVNLDYIPIVFGIRF